MMSAILLIALLAQSASASWPVVRLQIRDGAITGFCSAVCIDPSGVFLTAAHCGSGRATIIRDDGVTFGARIVSRDDAEPDGVTVIRSIGVEFDAAGVATSVSIGDRVRAGGYPNGGRQWSVRDGTVSGFSTAGQLIASISLTSGMSGGPLVNTRGEIVGLSSTSATGGERFSTYVSLKKIKRAAAYAAALKQRIVMFGRRGCGPCRAFLRDLRFFTAFDVQVVEFGDANYATYETAYNKVFHRRVTGVPTFWLVGLGVYHVGYNGPRDLLRWIASIDKGGQGRRPGPVTTDGSPPALAPPADQKPDQLANSLADLRKRLDGLATLNDAVTKNGSRLLRLQDRLDARKPVDLSPLVSRLTAIESRKPAAVDLAPLASKVSGVAAAVGTVSKWLPWIAGTAGTGGVLGIAGAVLGGLALLRKGRKVIKSVAGPSPGGPVVSGPVVPGSVPPPKEKVVPISIDSEPKTVVQTEQHYVPVSDGTYQGAVQYAHAQLVRKYPGALGTVDFIDNIVNQYLAGKGEATKET